MPPADPYGSGGLLVFDTSAWNRQRDLTVRPRWVATASSDFLAVCPVVALELLASARDEQKFTELDRTLAALPAAPVTRSAGAAAIGASRDLRGERRIPAADYLIAAAAAERGAGVLHYDRHFDALCQALGIESVWVAEPGSID
ncbi:MAG TPA: PIN domain-containing protein [Solirubrobacteraceae bacterium]|nr:PIN domain-containing protein [Solirubrobacteraceae bacterium]